MMDDVNGADNELDHLAAFLPSFIPSFLCASAIKVSRASLESNAFKVIVGSNYYRTSKNVKKNHECASMSDFVFMFLRVTIIV